MISPLAAQIVNDSLFVARAEQNMNSIYTSRLESKAGLYNGKMYHQDLKLDQGGHTLFKDNQYTEGTIIYNGQTYRSVGLMYDLVHDQLVLSVDRAGGVIVPPEYADSFSLHGHRFINIRLDRSSRNEITPGYYDLLYDGTISLLAKRTKKITETTNQHKVVRTVSQQNRYYLLKNDAYIPINNKKNLLTQLDETHQENQLFINRNRLNFRKDKEKAMIELLKFHDSIKE